MRSTAQNGGTEGDAGTGEESGAGCPGAGHATDNDVLLSALDDPERFERFMEFKNREHERSLTRTSAETAAYELRTRADAEAVRRVEVSRAEQRRRTALLVALLQYVVLGGLSMTALVGALYHYAMLPPGRIAGAVAAAVIAVAVSACAAGAGWPSVPRALGGLFRRNGTRSGTDGSAAPASAGGPGEAVSGPTTPSTDGGSAATPVEPEGRTAAPAEEAPVRRPYDRPRPGRGPRRDQGPEREREPGGPSAR
ncbi:hypothetical protein RVR_1559 [Actinacidiphila reveromycinica]|uniref:Uncharacterized protein n=1 Tax=Actinacidiphila reveromycinica TaxID=659352 RepID=A0A7U3UPK6_9ACTN|nr:hypothetical protein [Streptomyces sp. SN-593]BBA96316.1 hypothetical protein RVR_1559 [Streptomyces sp. SN-593]